jgi:glycosyltransferase involved in cell wall biosynthesis
MRILFLTQFFSYTRGGGPLIFFELAKAFSERGHQLFIICNVAPDTIQSENIKVFTVKPFLSNTYELPASPIQNIRYIANSVILGSRLVKKYRIEIIHTNSFTPVIAGSIISRTKKIPMIASIYDVVSSIGDSLWQDWIRYSGLPRYYPTIARYYEKLSLSMPFDMIHTISDTTRRDILLHQRNKEIRVVYPSIDNRRYGSNNSGYSNFILYIGRLVFYKNVGVLIRAYVDVIKELPTARLVIVGEGPMALEWENLALSLGVLENITFTSHLSHQEKADLLSKCAALALPSIFEGFGLVLLESFAMAKPVLAANVPPLDEIVDRDINGMLLTHDDHHEWARAIIKLLSDKQLCEKMGSNACKKFREKYDFKSYVDMMESLYLETIRGSRK